MFRDYEAERINKLAAPFGLTFDALAEAVPLTHYGPGGCDGVDRAETFEQVLALVTRVMQAERDRCAAIAVARYLDWGTAPVLLNFQQIAQLFRAVETEIKGGAAPANNTVAGIPYYGSAEYPLEMLNTQEAKT